MKWILDMVHHNPGETPFETSFSNPEKLKCYGYNGQVFKHINCTAKFASISPAVVPSGSAEEAWADALIAALHTQNRAAKANGLAVFYHIDLFVLPRRLVQLYQAELCDNKGRISIERPFTLTVHRALFDELLAEFPEVDGFIVRVGETYLFDTPYHTGNGPIRATQYEPSTDSNETEIARYTTLLQFLRQEICVKHSRWLLFRTWDCYPDKFHANLDYYLAVTNSVPPHEKLVFSIKHTALDFWRRVRFNPCIAQGKHRQIIEVQCQREYEGKGAYPNYIMDGVIDGFPECARQEGLRNVWNDARICGIFGWSRGGGWYGPYLQNELWCDLHAYVIAQFALHPQQTELSIFTRYATQRMGLAAEEAAILRGLCKTAAQAVLHGRYCEAYDASLQEKIAPTNLWMRDDRLGGAQQLAPVFAYLKENNLVDSALKEKQLAVALWQQVVSLAEKIQSSPQGRYILVSAQYGLTLYRIVEIGWRVLLLSQCKADTELQRQALTEYDRCWEAYQAVSAQPQCATLYQDTYLNLPGTSPVSGLGESIEVVRKQIRKG